MKKIRTLLVSFLVAACGICLGVALVGCAGVKDKETSSSYGYGEEGWYYFDAADGTYLMSLQNGSYMISADSSKGYAGTYSYNVDEKSISFSTDDGEKFEATFADDAMQFSVTGTPYTFLKKIDYIVTFMDGSSTVTRQTVTYGRAATSADAEKDGYIFIGWYEDASFTTPYGFNESVTGDLTLYAYYIPVDDTIPNFEVQFVSDGKVIYTTHTQNGVVYDFPKDDGVLGWWVSATNSGDELTYKYGGEVLEESTKLFAVEEGSLGASVYADRITWEADVSSVTVSLDGEILTTRATGNTYYTDLSSLATGAHEIVVTGSSYEERLIYVCNGLARVSNFSVYGNVLVYNKVPNAQYYYISVECANPSHSHDMVYNGNTLTYDFSNCVMGADGIRFTVYAYATGYLESVSETYIYLLRLDDAAVSIDAGADLAKWAPVAGATGYEVYVNGAYAATTVDTEYSLKEYERGTDLCVQVKPLAPGYYSELSETAEYTKATLAAPVITGMNRYTVEWSPVAGATNYIVYVNGKQVSTVDGTYTALALAGEANFETADSYVITVKAVNSQNTNQNSQESDAVYATDDEMSPLLVYEDGVVTWNYALAAGTYYVSVNEGDEIEVEGKNSFAVTFTQSGNNKIDVYFKNDTGMSTKASLTVTAYAVIFDTRGGEPIDTVYLAKGDTLRLADPVYAEGEADFAGWYSLPDLVGDYDSDMYLGDGFAYEDGTVFTGDSTLILYASWLSVKYSVILDAGIGYVLDENGEVTDTTLIAKNSETFTVAVPDSDDVTYVFCGWYSGQNGTGTMYADRNGTAVRAFNQGAGFTLYAYWRQVMAFELTTYQGETVLSAKAGEGIDEVTEITIPETYTYDGREYPVAVIGVSAFYHCMNLVTVNIPDTIQSISMANNGFETGSSAFDWCSYLENVNIYPTGDGPDSTKEVKYYSEDGVLFYNNNLTGYVELLYYPYGKKVSKYEIPSTVSNIYETDVNGDPVERAVTSIPTQVFTNKTIGEIVIPSTVVNIDTQAFYYADITKITFTGDDGATLRIGSNAFKYSSIEEITLPARYTSFDSGIFSYCTSLECIYISGTGAVLGSRDGVLCSADLLTILYYPLGRSGDYAIPTGVTTIAASAFETEGGQTSGLTGLTVAATVTEIGERAFCSCSSMTYLVFLEGENSADLTIRSQAFYNCNGLPSLALPQRLTVLEQGAFGICANLKEVTYDSRTGATSESLAGLKDYAFSSGTAANSYVEVLNLGANVPEINFASIFGGPRLQTVNIDAGNQYYSSVDGVVFDKDKTEIFYFPLGFVGEYVIPDTLVSIGADIFTGRESLTAITIPAATTEIAANAFKGCIGLKKITFAVAEDDTNEPSEITIGASAFSGCTSLTAVELPARLTSLGDKAFEGCTALEEITVESGSKTYTASYGVLYEIDEDGNASRLILCPINNKYTEIVIPVTITLIEASAFENNANVSEISFSEGTLAEGFSLGESVFAGCTGLEKITLPDGLTAIAASTFKNCASLKEVVIPSTVTSIGTNAFSGCTSLETLTFDGANERTAADKLTIEDGSSKGGAFYNCISLRAVSLPAYTVIGSYAFEGCTALEEAILGDYAEIGADAFYGCSALKEMTIPVGTTEISNAAFSGCSSLESVTVLGTVTAIGTSAFYQCTSLKSFTVPEGVTDINNATFYGAGIEEISFPASLSYIADNAFSGCVSLKTITVAEGNTTFAAGDDNVLYVLTSGVKTTLRIYPKANTVTTITVPNTVTTIYADAFQNSNVENITFEGTNTDLTFRDSSPFNGCSALNSVVLPEGITQLGTSLFQNAPFRSITIPSTVASVGNKTFYGCTSLETVLFTAGTEALTFADGSGTSYGTFNGCTSLKEIELPERTTTLGKYMFYKCSALEKVTIGSQVASIPQYAFSNCSSLKDVTFADGIQLTKIDNQAFEYTGVLDMTLPSTLTEIGEKSFQYSGLRSLTLPAGVTSIGSSAFIYSSIETIDFGKERTAGLSISANAFQYCYELQSLEVPATVTAINNYTFQYCTSLTSLTFETRTQELTIGISSFQYCSALSSVTIPKEVTSIGNNAFSYCSNLTSLIFETGSTLESIGPTAFGYTSLTSFSFPESTSTITLGNTVFAGCEYLTTLHISSSIQSLGTSLNDCTSISNITVDAGSQYYAVDNSVLYDYGRTQIIRSAGTIRGSYTVPSTVTTIATQAFQNQTELTAVVIPDSVTSIGSYAFDGCTALASVTLPSTITVLDDYMFHGCTALKSITLPDSITYLGKYTFAESGLESIVIPESVTQMGDGSGKSASSTTDVYTFYNCKSLKIVTFSSGLVGVGGRAFEGCENLSIITYTGDTGYNANSNYSATGYTAFPGTITTMGEYAFSGTGLIELTMPKWSTQGTYIFAYCQKLTTVKFDGDVTVAINTFRECPALKNLDLTGVTTINNYGFGYCTALESVTLPAGISLSGTYSFAGCTSLTYADVSQAGTLTATYLFMDCTALEEVVWKSGQAVGNYVFQNCSSLKTLKNFESVTSVGNYSFYGCESLYDWTPFGAVTTIGGYAFYGCGFTTVDLSGVTSISSVTVSGYSYYCNFQSCTSLQQVTLPTTSVNNIPKNCFDGCTSLRYVTVPSNIATINDYAFQNCTSLVEMDLSGVGTINEGAFRGCTSLVSVTLSQSIRTIAKYAFCECSGLEEITLPDSVTTINAYAFCGSGLESVRIPGGVTTISDSTSFAACTSLKNFDVDSGNTTFKAGNSGELVKISDGTIVTWPGGFEGTAVLENNTQITTYTFLGCVHLTGVTFPGGITSIPNYAFEYCTALENVTIPDTVTSIGNYAFAYSGLKSIVIGKNVATVNQYAFAYSALESVTFEGNPTTVGNYAFAYCESLTSVTFGENFTSIGSYMFAGCTSVETIYIPSNVVSVAASAFSGWTADQTINIAITEDEANGSWTSGWDAGCDAAVNYGVTES